MWTVHPQGEDRVEEQQVSLALNASGDVTSLCWHVSPVFFALLTIAERFSSCSRHRVWAYEHLEYRRIATVITAVNTWTNFQNKVQSIGIASSDMLRRWCL